MSAIDAEPFPRGALIAASALIGFSLIATTAVRLGRLSAPTSHPAAQPAPYDSVDLRFVDEADGSVSVRESHSNRLIESVKPGVGGFVRGVMRGLAHDRQRRGIGAEAPFRLSEWKGGRLSLEDTATGRVIDLEAFGSTNRDAFLQLLHTDSATS